MGSLGVSCHLEDSEQEAIRKGSRKGTVSPGVGGVGSQEDIFLKEVAVCFKTEERAAVLSCPSRSEVRKTDQT